MPGTTPPNANASNNDFEFAALQEAHNYRRALIKRFSPHLQGNVMEIGAGIGQLSAALIQNRAISRFLAVEPDRRFKDALTAALPADSILFGTARDVDSTVPWDCIVSVNVLEHIENDNGELALYRQLLAKGRGVLCLFVPARPEIYAPLDRDFGHYRRYTRKLLHERLTKAGFTVESLIYYNFIGYFAWWLNFCVLKKRGFSISGVRFFDRFIFPIGHGIESVLFPPPIGQNLMAFARVNP